MVFAIDIGNTNIVIGGFEGEKITFTERLSTNHKATSLEYAIMFKNVLEMYNYVPEYIVNPYECIFTDDTWLVNTASYKIQKI